MLEQLRQKYRGILQAYLGGAGESASLQAYDLARECMRQGLAPDDVVAMHVDLLEREFPTLDPAPDEPRPADLLLEIIVAFSIHYRQTLQDLEVANHELEDLSNFKSRMLSMVAHDLTNHILGVKLLLGGTLQRLNDAALREQFAGVVQAVEEEENLVQNLLDLSRIESGHIEVDLEPIGLEALLTRCIERARRLTNLHNFALSCAGVEALADRSKLQQIFDNLIGNAVKYSPDGGLIEVTADRSGSEVVVSITDHGLGIPASDLPHVFEPFYRGKAGASSITGTGLGLAIVKSLATLQHGRVGVTSTPADGTTFKLWLPASKS